MAISQYLQELVRQKGLLAAALTERGVTLTGDETFNELIAEVGNLPIPEPTTAEFDVQVVDSQGTTIATTHQFAGLSDSVTFDYVTWLSPLDQVWDWENNILKGSTTWQVYDENLGDSVTYILSQDSALYADSSFQETFDISNSLGTGEDLNGQTITIYIDAEREATYTASYTVEVVDENSTTLYTNTYTAESYEDVTFSSSWLGMLPYDSSNNKVLGNTMFTVSGNMKEMDQDSYLYADSGFQNTFDTSNSLGKGSTLDNSTITIYLDAAMQAYVLSHSIIILVDRAGNTAEIPVTEPASYSSLTWNDWLGNQTPFSLSSDQLKIASTFTDAAGNTRTLHTNIGGSLASNSTVYFDQNRQLRSNSSGTTQPDQMGVYYIYNSNYLNQ